MKLGILFSGGKDSTLALHIAAEYEKVACLITLMSKNKESYMFHTPNIELTKLQAESLGIPIITKITEGKKEEELEDLSNAIAEATAKFHIDGIVTGAVESVYQSSRIQRICHSSDIWCFNPLWKRNQIALLEELISGKFTVLISGIFAYPLDSRWLGKELNSQLIAKLVELERQFAISPSGEGGEIETTVLDAPMFKKRIRVVDYDIRAKGNSGIFQIEKAKLVPK